jgi:cytochrome P450
MDPAAVTLDDLDGRHHEVLAALRAHHPVAWLPALGGWVVTSRSLAVEVMRDAETFTVDDPRFSTAQVVGPSMLSLDGAEHQRHRAPFAEPLRPSDATARYGTRIRTAADALVHSIAPRGGAELRRELAGPLTIRS